MIDLLTGGFQTPEDVSPGEKDKEYSGQRQGSGPMTEKIKQYRDAADQGDASAQYILGCHYAEGEDVPQDNAEAVKWYRKAAESGNVDAQYNLGSHYAEGKGVPQDQAEAIKWYRKAAEQGDALAQYCLGNYYADGAGVPQDFSEAVKLFRKAAEQGDVSSRYNLGAMYENGEGVSQDLVQAYMWYDLAATKEDEDAIKSRETISGNMTPLQIEKAKKLTEEWRAKHGHSEESTGQLGDQDAQSLRERVDWFIEVGEGDSRQNYVKEKLFTELRENILEGKHEKDNDVVIHQKGKDGSWEETKSTLDEFSKSHFKLRILYQPVWSHAMAGLKWGALVGIALKLLDTLAGFALIDPVLAMLFIATIAVVSIPRFGMIGVIVVLLVSYKITRVNFFFIGLSAALAGAALGCLPGMTIGGIIGLSGKQSFPLARDAAPEPGNLVIKAVLLPLISGTALIAFYFLVFNPWLYSVLG